MFLNAERASLVTVRVSRLAIHSRSLSGSSGLRSGTSIRMSPPTTTSRNSYRATGAESLWQTMLSRMPSSASATTSSTENPKPSIGAAAATANR